MCFKEVKILNSEFSKVRVLTENGQIPIKNIKKGNLLYTKNVKTYEKRMMSVISTSIKEIDKLVHIFEEHPGAIRHHIITESDYLFLCNKGK